MKEFDLEQAKAGKPVCTRHGNKARIICFDKRDSKHPIVALIDNKFSGESTRCYSIDGKDSISDQYDLFMAEAWNKADDFVPDFSNQNQYKYYPWFVYDRDAAGFVWADTDYDTTSSGVSIGSRLCFKTANRARQFGEMFADLYNDVFLFK